MTLGEFFQWTALHPALLLIYFVGVPLIALLAGVFSGGEGHLSPWKYLYSTLIYLVSLPGIFAVTLSIYFFLFERRSILDMNLFTQVLPVLSMAATVLIIRRQVNLDLIPGFDKISGLILILATLICLLWIIDKTQIYSITFMPFYVVILILLAGFFVVRMGLRKLAR
ncbi:MAG: hypothetical protein IPP15_11245 [Saprospiraceae bacterium]|uniref:Uncharacterized protein n=1 Tax=Candidatus Opimibacter skivensis TaxID=2982028 RepID=A0A9D7XSW6_9BACT|nr:hypothetical protein [Candidatus Opimibacter skivensis]